jgi:serine/threonine protein kinase
MAAPQYGLALHEGRRVPQDAGQYHYGLCFRAGIDQDDELTRHKGTRLYMANELAEGSNSYTTAVDVYAYGMLLYEPCITAKPFCEKGEPQHFTIMSYITSRSGRRSLSTCRNTTKSSFPLTPFPRRPRWVAPG